MAISKGNKNKFNSDLSRQVIFAAIVITIIVYFVYHINDVLNFLKKIVSILSPIIIGFVLTYIMSPFYDVVYKHIDNRDVIFGKNKAQRNKYAKIVASVLTVLVVILAIIGLVFLFVPQLYNSITSFIARADQYIDQVKVYIENIKNNSSMGILKNIIGSFESAVVTEMNNLENVNWIDYSIIVRSLYNSFYFSLKFVMNIAVGLIVMIYALNIRDELCYGAVRLLRAAFNKKTADKILEEIKYADEVFSGFLMGKILDSLIIGAICYVSCLIMQMPYAPLIAVIVGVTNIIPFFGPFIGAIPSFLIVLLDEPFSWKPYGFLIFILLLQQLDGNVIGPKILGDKTGVKPFWVLFSILLFGGLFGFIGMIIAVPLWAIITRLLVELVHLRDKTQKN